MRYSNTAITELSAKYRSVLKKCALLNAAILLTTVVALPAGATFSWIHPDGVDSYMSSGSINSETSASANVFTGSAMRNIVNGDVTLILDGATQTGTSEINGVHGNAFFTSAHISTLTGATAPTDTQKTLRQYVDGDVSVVVKNNSSVARNVIGNQFYIKSPAEITDDIGLSGKTTVTVDGSIVQGDVRGGNIGDVEKASDAKISNLKVNDIEININDSLVEDEVVSTGAYLSAGNVKINVTGNSIIGYDATDTTIRAIEQDKKGTPQADGWIVAGAQRSDTFVDSTEINLNTAGKIRIAGDVNVGSRERTSDNTEEGSVKGDATLNILGGGTVNVGGALRAYHVAGTTALNIDNVTAKVGSVANEFDTITLGEGAKLDVTGAFNMASGSILNIADLLSGTAIKAGSMSVDGAQLADFNVDNGTAGTYTFAESSNWNDTNFVLSDKMKSNDLYDIDITTEKGKITLTKKSTDEVVENLTKNGEATAQEAAAISAIADTKVSNPVLDKITEAVQSGDVKTAAKAAKDLAPTTSQAALGISKDVQSLLTNAATARMASLAGRSGGDVFKGGSMWVQGLFNHTKQDSTSHSEGFKANSKGIAFGIDGKLNDAVTVGLGYGYTRTDADAGNRDIDVDGNNVFAYAEYAPDAWYVNGVLNFGYGRYTEKKSPLGVSIKSKYDVYTYGVNVMTGYAFDSGLTPEGGLRYLLVDQKSYDDGVEKIKTSNNDVLTAVLGAKYGYKVKAKDWMFTPNVRLAATYDLMSDESKAVSSITAGSSYQIKGERLHRLGFEAGVGVTSTWNNWDFTLSYDGGFRQDYQSHTGTLKAKYHF